ncbi:tripartite motif-containing protein 16-like [Colossoma macropomum]|uniref:tripartite motif-containing protein 16-like n=1 Tax=Colossoma macropomum TaxID=42526 RepID=UPI00186400DB|nr:tripartite motif-containing protein 16-like [Colossoma macropomum]
MVRRMAEASTLVDQDQFSCPVCLDLLKDPVTVPRGHSFSMVCINGCWDHGDHRGLYSCPQCRETFTPRPVLCRSYFIAEMLEKLKKTEVRAAPPAGSGDVECDFCTGRKRKAVKSCLTCLASFCEDHLKPHYEIPAWKKHKLVKASTRLQEKICSQHDKLMDIYCRTDQNFICYLCTMEDHKGHDTVSAAAERTQKQRELEEMQRDVQQRIQEKQKKLQELEQAVNTLKRCAQTAVEDTERIWTELICSIEKKRSELTELIRAQEEAELSAAEELLEKLEQEIADLKRRNAELEQLSLTEDHIHFLQSFQSLSVSSGSEDSSSISVHHHLSFDGVRSALSDLKERLEEFCREEFRKIPPQAAAAPLSLSEPKSREDFLQYFCHLTLDPNTAYRRLILSENNRALILSNEDQHYPDHPERFDYFGQVLSVESLSGRCYWEVEYSGVAAIVVSYKDIRRKGEFCDGEFGYNSQSWKLFCSSNASVWHCCYREEFPEAPLAKIGVYVDPSAGILSFYSVSDTMTLLHTVHTTFTQPLYAGFYVSLHSTLRLCDKNDGGDRG